MGSQTTDWEEIFTKNRSDKGRLSKTHKELLILNTKKTSQLESGPNIVTDKSQIKCQISL